MAGEALELTLRSRLREHEHQRKSEELEYARRLQLSMLPAERLSLPRVDIAATTQTATEVGGDYYDYFMAGHRALGVAIGDAAGSGVTAALLMASLQASFRMEAAVTHSPAEALRKINSFTYKRTQSERFVTFFYGLLDLKSGLFRIINNYINFRDLCFHTVLDSW